MAVLTELMVDAERQAALKAESTEWPSWDLTPRQLCDLELILNGGFSPLTGFLGRADYESVCSDMRLKSGLLWPMPITLDLPEERAKELAVGRQARSARSRRRHARGAPRRGRVGARQESRGPIRVRLGNNAEHPGVAYTLNQAGSHYVGGRLEGVQLPIHYDFRALRYAPKRLREEFSKSRVAQSGRVPNAEPDASSAPRAHSPAPRKKSKRTC